jgi:hypothetical protein
MVVAGLHRQARKLLTPSAINRLRPPNGFRFSGAIVGLQGKAIHAGSTALPNWQYLVAPLSDCFGFIFSNCLHQPAVLAESRSFVNLNF